MNIEKYNEAYLINDLDLDDLKALEYALNIAANKIDGLEVQLQGFVPQIAKDARRLASEVSNRLDNILTKKRTK